MIKRLNIDDILPKLKQCKSIGQGKWQACCPAHEDSNPSLSITEVAEKVLLYCHAGCSYEAILQALGEETPVFHANGHSQQTQHEKRITVVYDYQDQTGQLIFQKIRYEPKDFRVRRPDNKGGWIWNLGKNKPVLYRLPNLIDPDIAWQPVYIVEGEKDADRLTNLGLVATCNLDGASKLGQKPKWKAKEYNPFLAGRVVYVLADNDEPGQAHAEYIAKTLYQTAQAIKIINLPGLGLHGDVSDWLNMGNTKEELENFCLQTTQWQPPTIPQTIPNNQQIMSLQPLSMADLVAHHFEPLVFIVEGLIAKGHLVMLGGRPKSGKSWLVLQLAKCLDTGQPFLSRDTKKIRVLYFALEDTQRRVNNRSKLLKWQPTKQAGVLFHIARFDGANGLPGEGLTQLWELSQAYDLIVIDTLIAALSGGAKENDNAQMGAIVNELARIAHETDTTIIIVHHTGKAFSEDIFNTLRGASAIRGAYDVGLILERKQGEKEAILNAESRDVDVENMTLRQASNGAGWEYIGSGYEIKKIRAGRETLQTMLELAPNGEELTANEIADHRNVSVSVIYRQLGRLVDDGYIVQVPQENTSMGKRPDKYFVHENYRQESLDPIQPIST